MSEKVKPIQVADFAAAQHAFTTFDAEVPDGTKPEDLLHPQMFSFVANRVNPGDEIRVVDQAASWLVRLYVIDSDRRQLRVKILEEFDLTSNSSEELTTIESDEYEVKYRGKARWCVIRKADAHIVAKGIGDKARAYRELQDYLTALSS
jgi:hypothetical protein